MSQAVANSLAQNEMTRGESFAPVFLVGSERSGTTMLRLALDHHPRVSFLNEFEYVVDRMAPEGDFPPVEEFRAWLDMNRVFRKSGFEIDPTLGYADLVRDFLAQRSRATDKPIIGATVHRHFDYLTKIWPDARFIHVLRDGRDVARSVVGRGWAGNVWYGVERWIEAEETWARMKDSLPFERRHETRFEDITSNPEAALSSICEFLGVTYEGEMLSYTGNSRFERPDPKLAQQWRTKQTPREVRLLESRIGKMLVERGYELSGLPPIQVTPFTRGFLAIDHRTRRASARRKKLGSRLYWADVLSKRLGTRKWRRDVTLRVYALQNSQLR